MNKTRYVWVGLSFFFIFILASVPAQIISPLLNKINGLTIEGVSGEVWQGEAASIQYNGVDMGQAQWDISTLSLLLAKLSIDLSIKGNESELSGFFSFRPSSVAAENLKATFPAQWLPKLLKTPMATKGKLFIRMKQAKIEKQSPPLLYGALSWQQASLKTPFGAEARLGTINIGISTEQNWLVGNVKSAQGPMDLDALIKYKYPNTVDAKGSVAAKLPKELMGFFQLFTQKTKDGRLAFEYQGEIPKL